MQPPLLSPSLSNLCVKGVASSPHNIPKETKTTWPPTGWAGYFSPRRRPVPLDSERRARGAISTWSLFLIAVCSALLCVTGCDGLDRAGFGVGETRKHKRVVLCSSTPPNFIPHYKHDFTKNLISRHIFGRLSLDPPFLATCWRGAGAASKPIA